MYSVTAMVETRALGADDSPWIGTRDVPTFYLDERVQGITGKGHAARIALRILDPLGTIPAERIHLTVVHIAGPPLVGW